MYLITQLAGNFQFADTVQTSQIEENPWTTDDASSESVSCETRIGWTREGRLQEVGAVRPRPRMLMLTLRLWTFAFITVRISNYLFVIVAGTHASHLAPSWLCLPPRESLGRQSYGPPPP